MGFFSLVSTIETVNLKPATSATTRATHCHRRVSSISCAQPHKWWYSPVLTCVPRLVLRVPSLTKTPGPRTPNQRLTYNCLGGFALDPRLPSNESILQSSRLFRRETAKPRVFFVGYAQARRVRLGNLAPLGKDRPAVANARPRWLDH